MKDKLGVLRDAGEYLPGFFYHPDVLVTQKHPWRNLKCSMTLMPQADRKTSLNDGANDIVD